MSTRKIASDHTERPQWTILLLASQQSGSTTNFVFFGNNCNPIWAVAPLHRDATGADGYITVSCKQTFYYLSRNQSGGSIIYSVHRRIFLLHNGPEASHQRFSVYCIHNTNNCVRVEYIFAIFANFDFARNFPPAKIISTANGISRNFP